MIKAPRGTQDFLGEKAALWQQIQWRAAKLFSRYFYAPIATPTFEDTALFVRSIGEGSDIVRKEMYTFADRAGRSLTLRPEATAPVVRAFIEHKLYKQPLPVKFYYFANMFRYERPQAGRYREFWQLGVELIGSAAPQADAEVITLAEQFLMQELGLQQVRLKIGSMGDSNCRPVYLDKLKKFLIKVAGQLCSDCQERLKHNPLRVFDCKNEQCQAYLAEAPKIIDNLCPDCEKHFVEVQELLKAVNLQYVLDPMLVRGFDYYTRTTFELESPLLGAQNALGGGGRYDNLIADYDGPPTPAVGFALGLERLILALQSEKISFPAFAPPDVYVAVVQDKDRQLAFAIATNLRRVGLAVEVDVMHRSLKAQMKQADRLNVKFVVVLGPDELARDSCLVRRMATGEQKVFSLKELEPEIKKTVESGYFE